MSILIIYILYYPLKENSNYVFIKDLKSIFIRYISLFMLTIFCLKLSILCIIL